VLYSYDVEATGVPDPTFALCGAPAGMTIDAATGLIQWTPTAAGDFDVCVSATNSEGSDTQNFVVTVIPAFEAPAITSTPVTDGVVGVAYAYDVDATGYPAPTFSLTVFPAGMTIDAATGLISWTPGAVGDYDVTVVATNGIDPDASQSLTISVVAAPEAPVITSTPVTGGQVGEPYAYDVEATGNPAPTFALTVAPTGMTINSTTGLIQWTPADAGDFDVTVTASNGVDPDAVQSFTITVVPAFSAPLIYSTPLGSGAVGQLYTYNVDAYGYPAPTYSLCGAPAGMTIDPISGVIEWTPTEAGLFDVCVMATNDYGTDTQEYQINVPGEPWTDCYPQPTVLKETDRILKVFIHNEVTTDVILSSIRVQGKIPPYTDARIEGDTVVTDAFIMRFLGSSGFRPIPPEGIESTYTVEYDKTTGEHVVLTGDYVLAVYQGDVDLDGRFDILDVQYTIDYFFRDGDPCQMDQYRIDEFMDLDANGQVDLRDVSAMIDMLGL
jgi:hypothetical protein